MRFVVNGLAVELSAELVRSRLHGRPPEPLHLYGVRVDDRVYPVKQALEVVTGIGRSEFQSQTSRRIFDRLGFEIVGEPRSGTPIFRPDPVTPADPRAWPWEGAVQAVFVTFLRQHEWTVTSEADTATKGRGLDVLAERGQRRLGAEVKGWPSKGYADPLRADERKRTAPSNQAGHWFAQAMLKAAMLRDSHPAHESLIVLPDERRYRDLADRTRTGRAGMRVHVVLLSPDGTAVSESWQP